MPHTSHIDQPLNKLFIEFCNLTLASSTTYLKLPQQARFEKLRERYYNLVERITHARKFESNELHMEQQIMMYETLDIEVTTLEFETSSGLTNTLNRRRSI